MIKAVDNWLNRVTMYRLVLYFLIGLLGVAFVLSYARVLTFDPIALLFSVGFLLAVCGTTNWIFARAFGATTNSESGWISALILALIITPPQSAHDIWFLFWAGVLAMASKYIAAIGRKHLFNPVALAVAVTYLLANQSASWWVGSAPMLLWVLIGSLLIVRKLRRFDLVLSFLGMSLATSLVLSAFSGDNPLAALQNIILYSPLIFFAAVILTEPLTTPPTRPLRAVYGVLVGFLFSPQVHFGPIYVTPELALLAGNVFSYLVSPKVALGLRLKRKIKLAPDVYDFIFARPPQMAFAPGQYMEWTLGHADTDSRGNRRYFTLASSPTEAELRVGVKFYKASSSFKKAMLAMDNKTEIVASQLAGDFVLPEDKNQKLVFLAGGIGVTPFRSMITYMLDTYERRPIVLFYANKTVDEILYRDVFDRAQRDLGIEVVYTLTNARNLPASWQGRVGRLSPKLIQAVVPDYQDCLFYISGPNAMVDSFKGVLRDLGIKSSRIKTDFFPGFT
jgi:glycine betaine catabolism B